jgi:uncharacterized protein YdhG (YjbR/CyaY superfamily)
MSSPTAGDHVLQPASTCRSPFPAADAVSMMTVMAASASVDEYIASYPEQAQQVLREVRRRVTALVPEATEAISYGIPTLKLDGKNLVHYGAFTRHLSVYPVMREDLDEVPAVEPYLSGRGTAKFPLGDVPFELIEDVVRMLRRRREG